MNKKFKIIGMTCNSCVVKITEALKRGGYSNVSVTLDPPQGEVSSEHQIEISNIEKIVSSLGKYQVTELTTSVGLGADENLIVTNIVLPEDSLIPLFVIIGYLVGGVVLRSFLSKDFSLDTLMINFMGGFFIIFSMFKLLNLSGFAEAYATYDILAKKSRAYALAYPFVELALGVLYLTLANLFYVNLIVLILMIVGSIGVFEALRAKRTIQCACLGTALKLPMTKVTLAEDLLMGFMALAMIVL